MFRKFFSWKRLRKSLHGTGRQRRIVNLRDARRVGILYSLNEVADYDVVAEFVTKLQHDHKEVKALGFVKNKNLVSRFLPKLSYDFFSKKDINWFHTPVSVKVKDFIEQEFDILIDLSTREILPLKYIAGHSMAHCRVGRDPGEKPDCYDLMIDASPAMPVAEFIRQVSHYLSVINSHE
ncbi:MAG TPA: hypothetical protein VMC08_01630 [Bacteroidales bacterium]|nr:hypothetical protein [Bacteroidales bacterium]